MNELKRKMQAMVFGLLSLFVILLVVVVNGLSYWQQQQEIDDSLSSLENLLSRGRANLEDSYYVSDMPAAVILFDRQGGVQAILADDKLQDQANEMEEAVFEPDPSSLYEAGWIHRSLGFNAMILLSTESVSRHLQAILGISVLLAGMIEMVLWVVVARLAARMIEPIQNAFDKQKQFVQDASHELKTPLAVIMASAEAMQTDPQPKWLDNIVAETSQMDHLVTSLLDLSKTEQAGSMEAVNLSQTVEAGALPFEGLLYESGLKLVLDVKPDVMIQGMERQILQLTSILVDNAMKHGEKGTAVTVKVDSGKEAVLVVSNCGQPIPESEREKIFERFYRVESARTHSQGRYGLGLAIAKNIAAAHHASIKVACENGLTSFEVRFPLGTKGTGKERVQ